MTSNYRKMPPVYLRFSHFVCVSLLIALTACAPRFSSHGHQVDPYQLEQLSIGASTKIDVLDELGKPSFTGAFDEDKLYYVSQHMRQAAAGKSETVDREIYIFTFDTDGLLAQIDIKDESTGITVITLDAVTPTPGDGYGVVEQVFSNLRRRSQE